MRFESDSVELAGHEFNTIVSICYNDHSSMLNINIPHYCWQFWIIMKERNIADSAGLVSK